MSVTNSTARAKVLALLRAGPATKETLALKLGYESPHAMEQLLKAMRQAGLVRSVFVGRKRPDGQLRIRLWKLPCPPNP